MRDEVDTSAEEEDLSVAEDTEGEADSEGGAAVDAREERIAEHIAASLEVPDALQAIVGAASGDLLSLQHRLGQALDESLQQSPDTLTTLGQILPTLGVYLKVGQQADRYIQLGLKIKAAQGGG